MKKSRNIELLRDRLTKLLFLNNLMIATGQESVEALYVIEDEIKLLEAAYQNAADELEVLI